jgi:hypothetical protein
MADCPHCEYNKQRAQNWREEAYRLAGHPLPRKETMIEDDDDIQDYVRPWRGLTDEDKQKLAAEQHSWEDLLIAVEAKLKEKNT